MSAPLRFRWHDAILGPDGPPEKLARLVACALFRYADSGGGSCFPSLDTLMEATAMSRGTVIDRLRMLEADGWITRSQRGGGQGWRRNDYSLVLPEGGPPREPRSDEGGLSRDEGGLRQDQNVVHPVDSTLPENTTKNTPPEGDVLFEEFWTEYPDSPGKENRRAAERAWKDAVGGGADPSAMLDGVRRYAAFCDLRGITGKQYVASPANWLRDHRWTESFEVTEADRVGAGASTSAAPNPYPFERWVDPLGESAA